MTSEVKSQRAGDVTDLCISNLLLTPNAAQRFQRIFDVLIVFFCTYCRNGRFTPALSYGSRQRSNPVPEQQNWLMPPPREPLHDPPAQPEKDPPDDRPLHDPVGDLTYEPQRPPLGDPTSNPGRDPPPDMPDA